MNTYNTIEAINNFLTAANEVEKRWEWLYNEIGTADAETQDILHEIELSRLNAYEGFATAVKLREVRQRRRDYKNEKNILRPFKQWVDNHKSMTIDMFKILKEMKSNNEFNQNRVYHPRVRNDLKICSAATK